MLAIGVAGCGGGGSADTSNQGGGATPAPTPPPSPATPPPATVAVASITPTGGPAGTRVVIKGSGFAADAAVSFGVTAALVSFVSATELHAVVGASRLRGRVDVGLAQRSGSASLPSAFWLTASGLPGDDPLLAAAGVPQILRNELVHAPEVVDPAYGYQPWLVMIAPKGEHTAAAFVDWFEMAVKLPDGTERLVTRDDFGIELPMRSGAWGQLLLREPWGVPSGYGHEYLYLAPAGSPSMLVLDAARAPAGKGDLLYFHSWTRDWEKDPVTQADIGRACIPFPVPVGSQLVLRASFRSQGSALFQVGLDRYRTRVSQEHVEVALSDYHMNETSASKTVALVVDAHG